MEKPNLIMPEGCDCHGGGFSRECLTCKARIRKRNRLSKKGDVEINDSVEGMGFCVECGKVKPLKGSERAEYQPNEPEGEKRIICKECIHQEERE